MTRTSVRRLCRPVRAGRRVVDKQLRVPHGRVFVGATTSLCEEEEEMEEVEEEVDGVLAWSKTV